MKIYLASRYSRMRELRGYREQLNAKGHVITSRWLDGEHEAADGDESQWRRFAEDDCADIRRAECVISFTEPSTTPTPRGGRHVEFGFALALHKQIIIVGHRENVFHYLEDVAFFQTWEQALAAL